MVTNNFWPLLWHLITHEGWDATPCLAYAAPYLPTLIEKSPSDTEKNMLGVLLTSYETTLQAPGENAFFTLIAQASHANASADIQEFSSRIQCGMIAQYRVNDTQQLLQWYEEARDFYNLQDITQTAMEIYANQKDDGRGKHRLGGGYKDAMAFTKLQVGMLGISTGLGLDLRHTDEAVEIPGEIYYDTQRRRQANPPMFTGWESLDNPMAIGGFDPRSMVVALGATGHGKSTVVSNWMYNALMEGRSGTYISLELPSSLVMARFYAMHSLNPKFGTDRPMLTPILISRAELADDALRFLFDEVIPDFEALPGRISVYCPEGVFGLPELKSFLNTWSQDLAHPLSFFCLDHPGLMTIPTTKGLSAFQNTDALYAGIRQICNNINNGVGTVGLLPCQVNDEGRARAEKLHGRYDLGAIANSKEIGRSASHVFYVSSFEEHKSVNTAMIGCLKYTNGAIPRNFEVSVDPTSGLMAEDVYDFASHSGPMPQFNL